MALGLSITRKKLFQFSTTFAEIFANVRFCPVSAPVSNLNPRNIQCIPVANILFLLKFEQKHKFLKVLYVISGCKTIWQYTTMCHKIRCDFNILEGFRKIKIFFHFLNIIYLM